MPNTRRALIVDDEASIRALAGAALAKEGFTCRFAVNGLEALERVSESHYDLVITDLKMPTRNGHALAVDLLKLENRPLIVVLTGFDEPRIAKDLFARGIDDLVVKPVHFPIFAAKMKSLVDRRPVQPSPVPTDAPENAAATDGGSGRTVSLHELRTRLESTKSVIPISPLALEVFRLTAEDNTPTEDIAAIIRRDASLAADLLRLANTSFYNATTQPITDVNQAVMRIGLKRVGVQALAANMFSAIAASLVSWMDIDLIWRRSTAAGIAAERIATAVGESPSDAALCAGLHNVGRVILAAMYPAPYESMRQRAVQDGISFEEQERIAFPLSQSQAMAMLLTHWNLPAKSCEPLQYIDGSFADLGQLEGDLRRRAEIVKLSALIGWIVAGSWEPWDRIDLPSAHVVRRLGIESVTDLVEETQRGLFRSTGWEAPQTKDTGAKRGIRYHSLGGGSFDLFAALLDRMGFQPIPFTRRNATETDGVHLVNGLGFTHADAFEFSSAPRSQIAFVCCEGHRDGFRGASPVLTVPATYREFREYCARASDAETPRKETLVGAASPLASSAATPRVPA